MNPEVHLTLNPADLRAGMTERVLYLFVESGEFEATESLIPLQAAVGLGIVKIAATEDQNFWVVTPAQINTTHGQAEINVVSADWDKKHQTKQITVYEFATCSACGGPVAGGNAEITTPTAACQHCAQTNQSIGSHDRQTIEHTLEVDVLFDQTAWVGTPQELRTERFTHEKNQTTVFGRFKNRLLTGGYGPAPLEVIEVGETLVGLDGKIVFTGPYDQSDLSNLFVKIGEVRPVYDTENNGRQTEKVVDRANNLPLTHSSYRIEKFQVTDRGDYLVIIEADSGERLPFVVMTDIKGNPSRFAVPLSALMSEGWQLSLISLELDLNQIILTSGMNEGYGMKSTRVESLGLIKLFDWDEYSTRHDLITDALFNHDLDWEYKFVSADVPNGDVSLISIEHNA